MSLSIIDFGFISNILLITAVNFLISMLCWKENLSIKLTTTPVLLEIAEKVTRNWGEVGVKTTLQVTSNLPTEYEAFLAIYDIPSDPDQYSTWHSTQLETNITKYSNPRIDKLLEDGRLELDQEKRKSTFWEINAPLTFTETS